MTTKANVSQKPRAQLTKVRVFETALGLADENGIDSVTMRKLAEELGVEAMSIYHHVANKDEVLEGIVDLVASEIELPSKGTEWRPAVELRAVSAHEALMRHPWAGMLWVSNLNPGPERLRYIEVGLAIFREGGISTELTYNAFHAVENHIVGFTLSEANFQFDPEEMAQLGVEFLEGLPADEFPYLAEHVKQHIDDSGYDPDEFTFGLKLILDSLERIRRGGWSQLVGRR